MANRTAVIETNKGTIRVEMLEEDAPKTTENFITLAQRGYYDGIIFHRVIKGFMIQGGDPTGTGRGECDCDVADGPWRSSGSGSEDGKGNDRVSLCFTKVWRRGRCAAPIVT